ncbi:MAG: hypothetical protein HY890_07125, partial [Deltaproteobacteria bacterium]|nr:hypothetical protein [Deltaproteobacteria bacterium]
MGHRLKFVMFSALLAAVLLPHPAHAAREKGFTVVAAIIKDESAGMFSEPASLFFDEAKKRMYVADTLNNRLVSFDNDFRYLAELSHENFAMPMAVARTSAGEFFIVDGKTNEMKLVDVQNKVIKPFVIKGLPPAMEKFIPGRFSMDNDERIYVIDRLNRRIVVVDRDGNFIRAVSPPKRQSGGRVFYGFNDFRV